MKHLIIIIKENSISYRIGSRAGSSPFDGTIKEAKKIISYFKEITKAETYEIIF